MKKPFYKRWWFWVIIVLVALAAIGGMTSNNNDGVVLNKSNIENFTNSAKAPETTTYTVGDIITTNYYILEVNEINILDTNNYFITPDEGKEFVEIILTLTNTSNEEMSISSMLCFDAYVDDYAMDEDLSALVASDLNTMDGTVAAGKKLKGAICYQVPNDWNKIEVITNFRFNNNDKLTLEFNNQ